MQTVSLREDAAQLVVGCANSNLTDKYLTIYSYGGGQLVMEYQQACEAFLIADLNLTGPARCTWRSLRHRRPADAGGRARYGRQPAKRADGAAEQQLFALHRPFGGARSGRAQGIVVSGQLASGGTAQQVLLHDGRPASSRARFRRGSGDRAHHGPAGRAGPAHHRPAAPCCWRMWRPAQTLQPPRGATYFIEWDDYLAAEPGREYGVADVARGTICACPPAGAMRWPCRTALLQQLCAAQ